MLCVLYVCCVSEDSNEKASVVCVCVVCAVYVLCVLLVVCVCFVCGVCVLCVYSENTQGWIYY